VRKVIYTFLIGLVLGIVGGFYISNKTKPNIYIPTATKEYVNGKEITKYIYTKIDSNEIIKKNVSDEIKQDIKMIGKQEPIIKALYPKMYYTGKPGLGVSLIKIYVIDLDAFLTYYKDNKINIYSNFGLSYHLPYKRLSNTSIGICIENNLMSISEQNYRLYLAINF